MFKFLLLTIFKFNKKYFDLLSINNEKFNSESLKLNYSVLSYTDIVKKMGGGYTTQ